MLLMQIVNIKKIFLCLILSIGYPFDETQNMCYVLQVNYDLSDPSGSKDL